MSLVASPPRAHRLGTGRLHAMRTPLTTILGFTELLDDDLAGPLNPTQRAYIRQVQVAAERLQGVVDRLADEG